MERMMKVYVYEEGEAPLFHDGPCKSIYSTEGKFISEMEKGGIYRTRNPEDALVFFLPFSVVSMVHHLYEADSYDVRPIRSVVVDYIDAIARRHPFWNRSLGADHFMLSCHDWMERMMKVYVYEEGEAPLFHDGPCKSIYSTEGKFISEMEKGGIYRTRNPEDALVFFLPFSVVSMVHHLYEADSYDVRPIRSVVVDYIDAIARRHPFWNRSLGADHFMLSCHDWGPKVSSFVPHLFHRSIRVLCNANTSEGFNPSKDASLPEINLLTGKTTGLVGGLSPSRRSVLAFFAGRLHGHIRYLLLEQWKNKDQDVQVYDQLPPKVSYYSMLRKSRFCLCPSGYEVASPRVVEAIYAECVPVLISAGYVPPFSDVLNWKAFSVQVDVKDIPNIKTILMGISQRQYLRLYRRVKQVQRHFLVNAPPKRFDVFHMTLHSIWLRRLNIQIQDQ
ncbi:hypothetical protein FH972_002245 [Carpinus fangiana]|uniref:Exostosin GT47 domain-containing protein n=1 Tax=Carpinus fangiana TaxID=176857 RepID=A0A5N6QG53_9ROSI|nr:hypothetical protein FH972_002245 [Carpinus fangiana]